MKTVRKLHIHEVGDKFYVNTIEVGGGYLSKQWVFESPKALAEFVLSWGAV